MTTFAERLKQTRVTSGVSKSALARKTGISRQLLQQYESGDVVEPGAFVALKLAVALNVSAFWLVMGEGHRSPRLPMTEEERDLVLTYRGLTKEFKETLMGTAHGLLTASRGPTISNPYPPVRPTKK